MYCWASRESLHFFHFIDTLSADSVMGISLDKSNSILILNSGANLSDTTKLFGPLQRSMDKLVPCAIYASFADALR